MSRSFARLSTVASSGWCALPISRSRSLTTIPDEIADDLLIPNTHQYHSLLTKASTRLSASSHNLTDGIVNSNRSRKIHVNKDRATHRHRQSCRSPPHHASPVTCGSSLCARLDSTLTHDHDPYETPHYYTFHLTLRSPSNGPRRGKSLTPNRCGRNCRSSCNSSSESDKSKTHRCSGLGMNTSGNTGSVISAERDAAKGTTESETVNVRDDTACNDDGMPSDDTENPATSQISTTQTTQETDGKEAPDNDQRLKLRHPSAGVKCICFGIVDYLNTALKEADQDAFWESWCGNYGPVLTSAPPTGISDSESDIEPLAVSLNLPLNCSNGTEYEGGGGTPMRSKQCLKLLRWKSCHELLSHRRPRTLKRQLTDCSFQGRFSAGMVEVYDGNLGISVVPVSIGNCNVISSSLRTNIIPRSFSGEKGRVCFKGPASSPPSLVHSTNEKQWVEHNDKKVMFLTDKLLGDDGRRLLGVVKTVRGTHEERTQTLNEEARREVPAAELDCVLGIQEDDGNGPGLSEDEMQEEWSTGGPDHTASKSLWMPTKETFHRATNESSVRRLHPLLSDAGKTASKAVLIAPPDYRLLSSSDDGSRVPRHYSGASRQSSTRSHLSHMYSSQGNSSGDEDSDTGAELSELERRVLTLSHRRSQLRKQDTNACLIAPPEFKIAEDFYPRGAAWNERVLVQCSPNSALWL
ncbi:uncharacterized protein LOC135109352 [Scylla paramamosain]|uniref:uncharacterized protein LOC135109352 n=1 Tax=Scylla paramamosain TaxID=85552 RepID=UPI0030827BC6